MIIPGHIGGRMVKWLNTILVAPDESDNFYHFHDNRVLPPNVDQERAKNEGEAPAMAQAAHGLTAEKCQQPQRHHCHAKPSCCVPRWLLPGSHVS